MNDNDDIYRRFGGLIHEEPSAEDALRRWRDKQARQAIQRELRRRHTEILTRSLCGHPPYDEDKG